MLHAHNTQRQLHARGLAPAPTIESWEVEAGPAFSDETIKGVQSALEVSANS